MGIFLEDFGSVEDVCGNFQIDAVNGEILFAWYGGGDYDGSAFVLFSRDGELYEVNGSHCSCYGLEGQWDPEKTSFEELMHRITKGTLGQDTYYSGAVFGEQLVEVLNKWKG
jgi:hypothetical protein